MRLYRSHCRQIEGPEENDHDHEGNLGSQQKPAAKSGGQRRRIATRRILAEGQGCRNRQEQERSQKHEDVRKNWLLPSKRGAQEAILGYPNMPSRLLVKRRLLKSCDNESFCGCNGRRQMRFIRQEPTVKLAGKLPLLRREYPGYTSLLSCYLDNAADHIRITIEIFIPRSCVQDQYRLAVARRKRNVQQFEQIAGGKCNR